MTNATPAYMVRIRQHIRRAEAKADESLLAKLDVMSALLRARQTEGVPAPHVGQEAVVRLGRAIQSDISGANDIFRSHNALVEAKALIIGGPGHDDEDTLRYTASERDEAAA